MPYSIYKLQNHILKINQNFNISLIVKNFFNNTDYKLIYYIITYFFLNILVFTFDIALVYRITSSVWSIALYHYFIYIVILFCYLIFYVLKIKIRLHTLYRLSLLSTILIFIYLMHFFSSFHSMELFYGYFFLRSIATSLFFLAFHTSFLYGLEDKKRDEFSLLFFSIYTLLPVFLPIIGGFVIDYLSFDFLPTNKLLPDGYYVLYIFSFFITSLFLLFSPKMDLYLDTTAGFKKGFRFLFDKKFRDIRNYQIFDSFSISIRTVIYGLLVFLLLQNEFKLGAFSSLIAIVGSVFFLFVRNLEKKSKIKRMRLFVLGAITDVLSQLFFLMFLNIIGLTVKGIINTFVTPLKRIGGENILRKKYDEYSEELGINKSNFILLHELSYTIGRTFGIIVIAFFIFIIKIDDVFILFRYFIVLFILLDLLEYFLIKKIDKV